MKQYQKDLSELYRTLPKVNVPEPENPLAPKVQNVIDYLGESKSNQTKEKQPKGQILNSTDILQRFPWAR
jgi:hypothetical protein